MTATSDAYIVALDLKAGDSYDGQKSAYTIAKKDDCLLYKSRCV